MGNEHVIVFNCTGLPLDILEHNFLLGQYPCRKTYFMQQYDIKYIVECLTEDIFFVNYV